MSGTGRAALVPEEPSGASGAGGSSSPQRSSRGPLVAAAAIVLAIVIVLGLALAGAIPGLHLFGQPGSAPPPNSPPKSYTVTFEENGLPSGTSWGLTVNGSSYSSTTTSLSVTLADGVYAYTVPEASVRGASGSVTVYEAVASSGSVTVSGSPASVSIPFALAYTEPPPTYDVNFTESGLPSGTAWTVVFNGTGHTSSSSRIGVAAANGSYPYLIFSNSTEKAAPWSGTVSVSGKAVAVAITFTVPPPSTYRVTLSETGLPIGTNWSAMLGARAGYSTGSSIDFTETNGTYNFSIGAIAGYIVAPSGGSITVAGAPVGVTSVFTQSVSSGGNSTYPVTFRQSGLPLDVVWEVDIVPGSTTNASANGFFLEETQGSSLTLLLPNGSYQWSVNANASILFPPGSYFPTPSTGNVSVAGASAARSIVFSQLVATSTTYSVTITETGLPMGTSWLAFVGNTSNFTSAGSPVILELPNGSYFAYFFALGSYNSVQTTLLVDGAPLSYLVVFEETFYVNVTESGSATNATWGVEVNGTDYIVTGSVDSFVLANGSYTYKVESAGYTASPGYGSFTIAGSDVQWSITLSARSNHSVSVTERGLPNGTAWSVEFVDDGNSLLTSTTGSASPSCSIALPDGNYTWIVSTNNSSVYYGDPESGGLAIAGASASLSVTFTYAPGEEQVVFYEAADISLGGPFGLPNGSAWSVDVNGTVESSTGLFIVFLEPNGTYSYSVGSPSGYTPLAPGGSFSVRLLSNASLHSEEFLYVGIAFYSGSPPSAPTLGGSSSSYPSMAATTRPHAWLVAQLSEAT